MVIDMAHLLAVLIREAPYRCCLFLCHCCFPDFQLIRSSKNDSKIVGKLSLELLPSLMLSYLIDYDGLRLSEKFK